MEELNGIDRILMNISGGAASAVAWFRLLDTVPASITVGARFADTNYEHPSLYEFLSDCERHTGRTIERLDNDGRNIWDVFHEAAMIRAPGNGGCLASYKLKKQSLEKHSQQYDPATTAIALGMSFDEDDRMQRASSKLAPFRVIFPLCWSPILARCDVMDELDRRGIKQPELYAMGYPHNNCGGACVMAGITQWVGVLKDFPERFAECEEHERVFNEELARRGRNEHSILRDRRGGKTKNYTLRQLREDVEAGRRLPTDNWRSYCNCMGFAN